MGCKPQQSLAAPGDRLSAGRAHDPTPNEESDKASFMSGFKEPSFADRQKAAMEAKKNILTKFKSQ
ncbi:MAG: hypothetical protein JWQ94_2127, partial [Tardiphaga sp.]|nr:hypothetical protein [Tardiphaga sp.]